MNVKEDCQKNNLTLIALFKFIHESAANMEINLEGPLSSICEEANVNRTQVYERKKQIENALEEIVLSSPGRPSNNFANNTPSESQKAWELRERALRFRLDHPGSVVTHENGHSSYSDGFIRFVLDLLDTWESSPELFCEQVEVPYPTLRSWLQKDKGQPYKSFQRRLPLIPIEASACFRQIAEDFATWEGSLRDFFKYEYAQTQLGPTIVRRVLVLTGMLPLKTGKSPRYRGSTEKCQPGSILVTDGKNVKVILTSSGEVSNYNWQGIVDQTTVCHTAVVVTKTECATGVLNAFDASCEFLGRPPLAFVHDNKPIHKNKKLQDTIEKTTKMIPATLNRPENKAVIEGEFGKFEQAVGTIYLDDSSTEKLKESAVREVIRAYTAAGNHAGRFEYDGKSRQHVLQETCSDPEKDRKFIEQLHAKHTKSSTYDSLPTSKISLELLNNGFERFSLTEFDTKGTIRNWIAGRFTPDAIRQGLAIFGTERAKGRIFNSTSHRYLVKLIINCQNEIDLRLQEELLRDFAETEHQLWIEELQSEYRILVSECDGSSPHNDLAICLSEKAIFGSMFLERAFWENKLKQFLEEQCDKFTAVCNHVRRLFEVAWIDRFTLINKLISWENKLDKCPSHV